MVNLDTSSNWLEGYMRSSLGQRSSALRNRFRPSERRANQLWKVLIVLAVLLPIVSMGWEMARHTLMPVIVFALIVIIWAAVMWWGWRQGSSGSAQAAPNAPSMTTQPPAAGQQQAQRPAQTDVRKTSGRQAGRK
jgi:hypothetical protein